MRIFLCGIIAGLAVYHNPLPAFAGMLAAMSIPFVFYLVGRLMYRGN